MNLLRLLPLSLLAVALPLAGCAADGADEEAEAFEDAFEALNDPKADNACSGVVVPDQGPFGKKVVLTFDDGPNPATTPLIMETLRAHNAPATFFINGRRVTDDETRAIAKEIVDDPLFTLANHTHSHPNMATLSLEDAASQIDRTTAKIEEAGGEMKYFRFPFGSSTCGTMGLIEDRGFISTGWHIDSADWCFARGDGECKKSTFKHVPDSFRKDMGGFVMSQLRAKDGGIVLFHDIHPSTQRELEGILDRLEAEGYEYTSIDDIQTLPLLHGEEQAFIGDPCESDSDCNFAGGFCLPEVDGGYCTQECESSCPDRAGYNTTRCVVPPLETAPEFTVCSISCTGDNDCRDGLSCQPVTGANGQARSVCF